MCINKEIQRKQKVKRNTQTDEAVLEWNEEIEGKEEKDAAVKQSNLRDLMWPFCNLE